MASVSESPPKPIRFRVIPSEAGMMLRNLLVRRLSEINSEQAAELVKAGGVYVNKYRVRLPSVRVVAGERVTVYREALSTRPLAPEEVRLVYRAQSFVAVDKPAGVPVAATRTSARGTLAEAIVHMLEAEGFARPYVGVVHRLDRGASGLTLLTIRSIANSSFHQQFLEHRIERTYVILVEGEAPESMECDSPVLHLASGGVKIAADGEESAKAAHSRFARLAVRESDSGPQSLLEVRIDTGRTHQIRAHAAHQGFPVVGDGRYGDPPTSRTHRLSAAPRDLESVESIYLHAWKLSFEHPETGEPIALESPLPAWAKHAAGDDGG